MTLVAYPLPTPRVFPAASSTIAARGFVELDDRICGAQGGVAVVRAPSREAALAMGAHAARRARAAGLHAIETRASAGAPLWREVASRVGVGALASDPIDAADAIARAALLRRAVVVAALPADGSWDRAVAAALAAQPVTSSPPIVLLALATDGTDDLQAETYDVGSTLNAAELPRWWSALADAAQTEVTADDLASLETWWHNARHASLARATLDASLGEGAQHLACMLSLVGRAWPTTDVSLLGADPGAVEALARAGAARVAAGWLAIEAAWEAKAGPAIERAGLEVLHAAARALLARFDHDPWAQTRAAELYVRAGSWNEADEAHTRAVASADGSLVRRELVARWMAAVATLPREAQLPMRVRATERALAVGEAEEAFRWAQSATSLAPHDAEVGRLFGRAAVILGDLVAAKVALERGSEHATDDAARAIIAAELAEIAYLGGDFATATREAERALSLDRAPATKLKARNTLGKLLLAESSWDAADVHFAEDAWTASAGGLHIEELRARLNRGIALLSKGLVDEARSIFEAVLGEGERIG